MINDHAEERDGTGGVIPTTNDNAPTPEPLDSVIERFEAAWRGGEPDLDSFIAVRPGDFELVLELCLVDLEYRRKRGRPRDPAAYADRFSRPEMRQRFLAEAAAATAGPASRATDPLVGVVIGGVRLVRLDVYSLGVILYELLAGQPPYDVRQKAIYEVARVVREVDPTPLSTVNRTLRRDVSIIAGKCLEKDRGRRYSSASEVAADVGRYLAGEPVTAAPPSLRDGRIDIMTQVLDKLKSYHDERIRLEESGAEQVSTDDLRRRGIFYGNLGRLSRSTGDLEAAGKCHAQALAIADLVAKLAPRNPAAKNDRCVVYYDLGDLDAARRYHQEDLGISALLVKRDPQNQEWQRGLAAVHDRLGALANRMGDLAGAHEHHGNAFAITAWRESLGASHDRLGNMALTMGDLAAARAHHVQSLEISTSLVAHDPRNSTWRQDMGRSHERLGTIDMASGDLDAARQHFGKALDITKSLIAQDPVRGDWQQNLALMHSRIGDLARADKDLDAARDSYESELAITTALATRYPQASGVHRDLAIAYQHLGLLAKQQERWAEARDWLVKEMAVADRFFGNSRAAEATKFRVNVLRPLAECHRTLGEDDAADACEERIAELQGSSKPSVSSQ